MDQIVKALSEDNFTKFQELVTKDPYFDLDQKFSLVGRKSLVTTLLDLSCFYGSVQCFKYLVCNNASLTRKACVYAFCGGNYEIIHYFENNDFEFDEECIRTSVSYHRYEVTDWLLQNFADSIGNKIIKDAIENCNYYVLAKCVNLNIDLNLVQAVLTNNLIIVRYCIECEHKDPNTKDKAEPILVRATEKGYLSMVRYLIETQNVLRTYTPNDLQYLLYCSVTSNVSHIVQYLVEKCNIPTNVRDKHGALLVHNAAIHGAAASIEYLIEKCNADINDNKDNYGRTPLHYASIFGNFFVIIELLRKGADTKVLDKKGKTAYMYAKEYGDLDLLNIFHIYHITE